MTCRDCVQQLTGYLDGDVTDERGAMIRGHLRGCADCQRVANHEALIRDGLRALPSADPPAHLWAAIAANVAQQEVALAAQPVWQQRLHRLRGWVGAVLGALALPQLGRGGTITVGAAAAVTAGALLWWKLGRPATPPGQAAMVVPVPTLASDGAAPGANATPPPQLPVAAIERQDVVLAPQGLALADDVSADLRAEQQSVEASYVAAVAELLRDAAQVGARWTPAARARFAQRNQQLAEAVAAAKDARPRARAFQLQLRFLQSAVVDQVASIEGDR
ncbi:MAG: zf-HC2 domain-containing protein [Kofleriaceae bacterium]|nr:zf-HC2 domain-containing protein [Kofleriaceae bacterium]